MFTRRVRLTVLCLAVLAATVQMGCTSTPAAAPAARDGLFLHVKSGPEDAHSVLMGLRMAQLMADDHDVLVYFDVAGIRNVLQGAPDLRMAPFGSSHAMVQDLIARKVAVYACPGCLTAMGKTPDQLMPGVRVAEKEAFYRFTRGRILTLDY